MGLVTVAMTCANAAPQPPVPQAPSPQAPSPQAQAPQTPAPQAQPASAQDPAQPTFRTGATFVRVDAYVTKGGVPVPDLKAEDFVLKEDGVPQTIRSFEYVHIPNAALQPGERRDPNTVEASREAVADPRRRVFVIFLDTYHVTQGASMNVRGALLRFLQRIIGPDDLVAAMTPDMPPDGLAFGARTDTLEGVLNGIWGKLGAVIESGEEQQMEACFPPKQDGTPVWPAVRDRRRAKLSMDAMEGLVQHLGGLREERKAIITISEGWALSNVNLDLMTDQRNPGRVPTGPTIGVGPDGRLGTGDRRGSGGFPNAGECDAVRMEMAGMDTVQQFRDLPDFANRANASFYTVDPRGLAAFDSEIGPDRPPSVTQDAANLRGKLDMLRELAERTDGLAAVNSNDLDRQLKRIADDLSSYYLIGYDSSNPKMDGRFRSIHVRVTRPGMQVRARRGYRAVTLDEQQTSAAGATGATGSGGGGGASGGAASGAGAGAGGGTSGATAGDAASGAAGAGGDQAATGGGSRTIARSGGASRRTGKVVVLTPEERMAAAITSAVGALTSTRNDVPLRTRLTARPAAGEGGAGSAAGGELRIVSELNRTLARSSAWQQGGTARIIVRGAGAGADIVTAEATLAPGTNVLQAAIPLKAALAPGEYRILLRLTAQSKIDAVSDTVPLAIGDHASHLLMPVVLRRGPTTGTVYAPTADLRFTRQERIRLEWPETAAPDALDVSLVNQRGDAIKVPVQVTARDENGTRLSVVDFAFAPLAPGGYALLAREKVQAPEASTIVPLQVIP